MRSKLTLFAAVCAASLALSSSASATTVLQFAQRASSDFVSATVSGGTTTLNTNGVSQAGTPLSIPITITQEGTAGPTNALAFETFLPALTSSSASSGSPPTQSGFSGTIIISSGTDGTGGNFLTAVISNGRLDASGPTGSFLAGGGGGASNVTLTSADPNIAPLLPPGPNNGAVSLSFVNINPVQPGAGFTSFTAQNSGLFSTVSIPEPTSFIPASTAILAGLGCFGWSRRKSLQV
jgi:hypothetical protein